MFIYLLILLLIFLLNLVLLFLFKKLAIKTNLVAHVNHRSLHAIPIPTGGGIIFSTLILLCFFLLWSFGKVPNSLIIIVGVGGLIATFFGFIDDLLEIKAKVKLVFQILLSCFTIFCLDGGPLLNITFLPNFILILFSIFFLIWFFNAFNFMDGIDGLAASSSIVSSILILISLILTSQTSEITSLLVILVTCLLAFLTLNWPPAKIFMGDSGSFFLGYIHGVIILSTIMHNEISFWTWIIVFSYLIADTSLTVITRIILVKKWYLGHKSHAYQNIARVCNSHSKVSLGIVIYNFVFILPLTVWSVLVPDMAFIAAIIAILPSSIFSFKYGPRYSSI